MLRTKFWSKPLGIFDIQKIVGLSLSIVSLIGLGGNLLFSLFNQISMFDYAMNWANILIFIGFTFCLFSIVFDKVWLRYSQLLIIFSHCMMALYFSPMELSGWGLFFILVILGKEYGLFNRYDKLKFTGICLLSLSMIIFGRVSAHRFWQILSVTISGGVYLWFFFFLFYVVRRKPMDERELDGPVDDILSEQSDSSSNESVWDKLEAISDYHFTKKEISVLCLFLENDGRLSNKEIADRLGCGVSSVKNHLSRIAGKLGTHSRAELLKRMMDLMKG